MALPLRRRLMQFYRLKIWEKSASFRNCMFFSNSGFSVADPSLVDCSEAVVNDIKCISVIPDFVSREEEEMLMVEIRRTLRGKKYMYDHWDGVRTWDYEL